MKFICFVICCLLLQYGIFARQGVRGLRTTLGTMANDSEKIEAYDALVAHYSSLRPDSAIYYGSQAIQYANGKYAGSYAGERNYSKPLISIYKQLADIYKKQGKYKEALNATEHAATLADSVHEKRVMEATPAIVPAETDQSITQLQQLSNRNAGQRNVSIAVATFFLIVLVVILLLYASALKQNRVMAVNEKELKELNATKDKLFSVIGHDLRGPIARIPAILDIYEDENTNEEEKKFLLDNLKEHTKASLETFDKLLYWGLSLVKGIQIHQVKMNPKGLITEGIELRKIKALEKHIKVIDHTPADIFVYADLTHFDFIIRNLLANALKYTYQNGLIEINAEGTSRPGFTVFSVKDNGVGIAPELLPQLFKPLKSSEGTAHEKGHGIGLMLCKEFAVQNGGDLWVESEPGKGATFFFSVKSQRKNLN